MATCELTSISPTKNPHPSFSSQSAEKMKTEENDRRLKASRIRRSLSCLRPKGAAGKCWLKNLKNVESEVRHYTGLGILFYFSEENLQFFIKEAARADIEKAWPSKKAEERYREGIKYLVALLDEERNSEY